MLGDSGIFGIFSVSRNLDFEGMVSVVRKFWIFGFRPLAKHGNGVSAGCVGGLMVTVLFLELRWQIFASGHKDSGGFRSSGMCRLRLWRCLECSGGRMGVVCCFRVVI